MVERVLTCKKCGGTSFSFRWFYDGDEEALRLYLCHHGVGFQLEDAIVRCEECGEQSIYESESFLNVKEKFSKGGEPK